MSNRCSGGEAATRLELCQKRADPRPGHRKPQVGPALLRHRRPVLLGQERCGPPVRFAGPAACPGDTQDFAVLPAGARPKYTLYIPAEVSPPDSFAAEGDIVISPDGRLYSNSFPLSESEAFTSLAGISYPVGS